MDRFSIFIRLILGFVLLSLIPLAIVSGWMLSEMRSNMQERVLTQLQGIAETKVRQIDNYLWERISDLTALASDSKTQEELLLRIEHKKDLQKGSSQSHQALETAHDFHTQYLRNSEYSDLLLIDKSGHILHSAGGYYDPGSSLFALKSQRTALIDVVNGVMETYSPGISSLSPYPGSNLGVVYLASPVFVEAELVGILALRIDAASFEEIVRDSTGMGSSGESMMAMQAVDAGQYVFDFKYESEGDLNRRFTFSESQPSALQLALQGEQGGGVVVDYRGREVVASWRPVPVIQAGLVTKIDASEAFFNIKKVTNQWIFILVGVLIIIFVLVIQFASSLLHPITLLTSASQRIAKGNFDEKIALKGRDEFGQLAGAFNQMMSEINISHLKQEERVRSRTQALKEANIALQRSAAELRQQARAMKESPVMIVITDINALVQYVNPAFTAITGYSSDEVIDHDISLIKSNETPNSVYQELWSCLKKGQTWKGEILNRRKSGETYWSSATISPVRDDNGVIVNYVSVQEDISERKKTALQLQDYREHLEEMLAEQTAHIKAIVDTAADAIVTIDDQGKLLSFNRAAENMFGYSAEEIIGQNIRLLMPEEYQQEHDNFLDRYSATGEKNIIGNIKELQARHKDGNLFFIHLSVSEMQIGDEKQFTGIIRDISEQKRAEQELRENELSYRMLFESSSDAIVLLNDNSFIDCNHSALELFGCPDVETFTRFGPVEMSPATQPDGRLSSQVALEKIKQAKQGGVVVFEWQHSRYDNHKRFTAEVRLSPTRWQGEEVLQGVVRDISIQKSVEAELRKSKELAEEASNLKSEFLATMSHEIRTPMHAIIGFSELAIQDSSLKKQTRQNILNIHNSAKSLLNIINEILDLSRLESGKLVFESIAFPLKTVVQDMVQSLDIQARNKSLELKLEFAPDLPEKVVGDPTRLRQVLVNLVGNAIKFTEQGQVAVSVDKDKDKHILHFVIADTGIGMTPDELQRIFEVFTQADATTTRRFGGSGLGTNIAKQIVEQMGGQIWAESELGKGSEFHFTVMLHEAIGVENESTYEVISSPGKTALLTELEGDDDQEVTATDKSLVVSHQDSSKQKPEKLQDGILVVEDNLFNQDLIIQQLANWGYRADIAGNGKEAEEKWRSGNYRLILSDISMPVMDGYELVSNIRDQESGKDKHVTIIAMTANAMAGEKEKCLERGFDDFLPKPVELESLKIMLSRWFGSEATAVFDNSMKDASGDIDARQFRTRYFNPEVLTELVGDNFSVHKRLLEVFIQDAPPTFSQLTSYIQALDFPAIADTAHKLKSSARGIGATELVDFLQHAETAARDKDTELEKPLKTIEEQFSQLIEEIKAYLDFQMADERNAGH